jgi:hypothetical protein
VLRAVRDCFIAACRDLNDGGLLKKVRTFWVIVIVAYVAMRRHNYPCLLSQVNRMMSGGGLDYVIISYVLIYCTDDPTADMLARLLTVDQAKAVLISERNQENEMIARMEARQINVSKLMGQQGERDDRQMVWATHVLSGPVCFGCKLTGGVTVVPSVRVWALTAHRCFCHHNGGFRSRPIHFQAHSRMFRASTPRYLPAVFEISFYHVDTYSVAAATRNINAKTSMFLSRGTMTFCDLVSVYSTASTKLGY